jgi:hypothetical protein
LISWLATKRLGVVAELVLDAADLAVDTLDPLVDARHEAVELPP